MIPEKSMFFIWKALNLSCPNGNIECTSCEAFLFCESLIQVKYVLIEKFPEQCEHFDYILKKEGED